MGVAEFISACGKQGHALLIDMHARPVNACSPCECMLAEFISACGKQGHALLIDCRPPFATEHVPLDDPDVALVVANSNVKHSLSEV